MNENEKHMQDASDDDAPDMSAPYWADKLSKVTVQRGRPKLLIFVTVWEGSDSLR